MIASLTGRGDLEESADFLVIGAGTAGLPASVLLAERTGRRVICLESGGLHQDADTHPLNAVVQRGETVYQGAELGRFRCLGGTSTRWGGALIPFQPADLVRAGWPVGPDDLAPHLGEVEALFGLEPGPYADPAFPFDLGPTHVNRLAKWPAFGRRNVVNLVGERARALPGLSLWLDATVTGIRAGADGVQVEARSPAGDRIRVAAGRLIIAAGAIETTRLALLLDRAHDGAISRLGPDLGRHFCDHLSTEVAEITPLRTRDLNRIIGFRFTPGGGMRNIRFEFAPAAAARDSLPPVFAHVGFAVDRPGGFDALRELFRWLQMRRVPPVGILADLVRNTPWLARAVWWRFVQKRLLFPAHSRLRVHMVVEQVPDADNRITLSDTEADAFGIPRAEIRWRIGADDLAHIAGATELFERTWTSTDFARYGRWESLPRDDVRTRLLQSGGIYHPTGSTRMGAGPGSGVVDRDLKLFAFPRIQLLSTSVLPTGGGANPTMMLLLLALRCVDQHARAGG